MYRVTRRGVEVPKDSVLVGDVLKDLTVTPICLNDFPKKFRVYLESPTHFVVPLHWITRHKVQFDDQRPRGQHIDATFHGSLRKDLKQPEAVQAVIDTWKSSGGGALLCLPVGFGKSTCALYLVSRVRKKTLVLVHKSFLKDQWVDRAKSVLPGCSVSVIQGAVCDTTGDITVAMIQTLVSRKFAPDTFDAYGLVIVDEVHHLAATGFSQSMWSQCAPLTLGLSATPRRADGLMRVVEWFCGPIAFFHARDNQHQTIVQVLKYTCPEYANPPPVNRRGDVCYASLMTCLVEDPVRTELVASKASALACAGHHVLVLTHRRQHVQDLAGAIRRHGVDAGTYVGGDKECPDTVVVVATYALTSEGFDVPRLNALVLATPASDVEQACGRVMRGSATAGAVIVDVLDEWSVCWSQHAKRRTFYKKSGFTMPHTDTPKPVSNEPMFI